MKTPFDTTDLENGCRLSWNRGSGKPEWCRVYSLCPICRSLIKERQRLKAEVEKIIEERISKHILQIQIDDQKYNQDRHKVQILELDELKKRLGL